MRAILNKDSPSSKTDKQPLINIVKAHRASISAAQEETNVKYYRQGSDQVEGYQDELENPATHTVLLLNQQSLGADAFQQVQEHANTALSQHVGGQTAHETSEGITTNKSRQDGTTAEQRSLTAGGSIEHRHRSSVY